jgi:hypothetical protein
MEEASSGVEANSGRRLLRLPGPAVKVSVALDWLKSEGVVACRNHRERNGTAVTLSVKMPSLKPGAEPWIEDVRLSMPEIRGKPALNPEMVQLQLDDRGILGKIATNIVDTHVQTRDAATFTMRSNHHSVPASSTLNAVSSVSLVRGGRFGWR